MKEVSSILKEEVDVPAEDLIREQAGHDSISSPGAHSVDASARADFNLDQAGLNAAPRVAIVIVNYSAAHYSSEAPLMRCLKSLRTLSYPNYFVVIIDNASPDGSGERLLSRVRSPGVEVILNPENRGFGAACNVGMKYATVRGAEFLWLLNPDTAVESETLTSLVASSIRGRGAVCGSKVLYGDPDIERVWSAGGEVDFHSQQVSMRGWNEIDDGRFDEERDCAYLPGCSLFVPRAVLDVVGYMPEEYFLYFEETSWCTEMRKLGVALRYTPESVVRHFFDDPKMSTPQTVYYYNRNERLFFYRYGSAKQRIKLMLKTMLRDIPRASFALFSAKERGQRAVFRAQRRAYWDFVFGRVGPGLSSTK